MNPTDITLIVIVVVVGGIALRLTHVHGARQKQNYENEAIGRLEHDLSGVITQLEAYEIFRYIILFGKDHAWGVSNLKEMKDEIIQDCTKPAGNGNIIYGAAEYSLSINKEKKEVYYVVGKNEFDFSEIEALKSHNKSFKLPAKKAAGRDA